MFSRPAPSQQIPQMLVSSNKDCSYRRKGGGGGGGGSLEGEKGQCAGRYGGDEEEDGGSINSGHGKVKGRGCDVGPGS